MPSKVDVIPVPAESFGVLWPFAGALFLRGIHKAQLPVLETMDRVRAGDCQLWIIKTDEPPALLAVFLTEIVQHDDDVVIELKALSGAEPKLWGDALSDAMCAFGRQAGCRAIRFAGSEAWMRLCNGVRRVGELRPGVPLMERPCHVS